MDPKTAEAPQTTNAAAREQLRRRLDGWSNAFSGLGTSRDKRTAGRVEGAELTHDELEALYRDDATAARIVEKPVEEMLREWFDVQIADVEGKAAKEAAEGIEDWLERIGAREAFRQALCWRRAYGGAGILLGVNGGDVSPEELARPLRPEHVKSIDHLTVFHARELQAVEWYANPLSPRFGRPSKFRIVPQVPYLAGQGLANAGATTAPDPEEASGEQREAQPEVHTSWLLTFDGILVNRRQRAQNWGWGDSVLRRCYEVIRDFGQSNAAAAHLIQDFAQGILSIPGLLDALASDSAEVYRGRVEMLDTMRSVARMLVLDGGDSTGAGKEEFHRDIATLAGVPEILDRMAIAVAAAADMPVTLLLGTSAKGLNATGEGDRSNWYDHVKDLQTMQVSPQARRLIDLGMRAPEGPTKGKVFEVWSIKHRPLWQLSEKERAEARLTTSTADEKDVINGILSPDEVRRSRYSGDGYSLDTQIDTETREAFDDLDPEVDPKDPTLRDPAAKPGEEPPAMPKPADGEAGAPVSADLQALAMNGAQVTGGLEIVKAVREGIMPAEAAVIFMCAAYPYAFNEAKAQKMLGMIEVKEPPPPPDPLELAKARAQGAPPPGAPPERKPPQGGSGVLPFPPKKD